MTAKATSQPFVCLQQNTHHGPTNHREQPSKFTPLNHTFAKGRNPLERHSSNHTGKPRIGW